MEEHIKKLKERFGKFKYAPHRLPFNPYDKEQIKLLLPLYKGPIMRIRIQSFSSRQSGHSGTGKVKNTFSDSKLFSKEFFS